MAYIPPNINGQTTMANSAPVTIASDQTALNVAITSNTGGSSMLSTANSSAVNIAASGTFTGTGEDVTLYSEMRVSVFSSHASATNGLSVQQSSDNTNWDITDTYTVSATTALTIVIPRQERYFRVVYTNGATLTTSFRLQTILNRTGTAPSSQRPADAQTNEVDLTQQQGFMMGYNGTTWDRVRTTGTGVLSTSSVLTAGAATIGSIASITTSITPGTAATSLGKARAGTPGTTDTGVVSLTVRNDNAATAVNAANGTYGLLSTDTNGSVFNRQAPANTSALTTVTSSATSVTLLAANPARRLMTIYNASTSDAYVKFGTTASTTSFTIFLPSLGSFSLNGEDYAGRIDIIWNSANGFAYVTETSI